MAIVAQVKRGATFDQDKLRDAVSRVVPGVKPSAIIFSVSEQVVGNGGGVEEPLVPFLKYWKVPSSEYNGLSFLLIGLMSVVAFLTGVAGYIYGQYEGAKGGDLPPVTSSTGQLGGRPVPSREEDEEV